MPPTIKNRLLELADYNYTHARMTEIFDCFNDWCDQFEKPVVLIIDEVDSATKNQVFLDFLAQLREAYLNSDITPTFQSVILAGVHDVRNIKRKIRPDEAHKVNSPWNIASIFRVDMSFFPEDIAGMLKEYETDLHTGMNIEEMSHLMFGFIKNNNGTVAIYNRIFESVLYNLFISEEFLASKMSDIGALEKNQFIVNGDLDVRRILEKFPAVRG